MSRSTDDLPEVLSYRDLVRIRTQLDLKGRTSTFSERIRSERGAGIDGLHYRRVLGPIDREVFVTDHEGATRPMLMFGSNNYLGLATHPVVVERVRRAALRYGVGVGGPPILNGYGPLQRELEERLADLEEMESALVYGSGYAANVGLMSALPGPKDLAVYDERSHASFLDGLKLGRIGGRSFAHNDLKALDQALEEVSGDHQDIFVGVEGVYSMSGDLARLDRIADISQQHGAILVVDDAHGTGVTGPRGHGTIAMFDVSDKVDVVMGTFSKSFSVSGGFVTASKDIVDYLRYFSRSYVFSASLSPSVCAAVIAGLDVLEDEPEVHGALSDNTAYLAQQLQAIGLEGNGLTAIFSLPVPRTTDVRAAAHDFHRRGLFLNHVEAPAVPISDQRFRISVSATHTKDDLDRLIEAVDDVWNIHVRPFADDSAAEVALQPNDGALDAFEGGF
ncbi:aminotransferase class I/II-fold pyridoxal phosphate-dependent enzyme [Rubrivirga sp.]|uniref:aminotransferase class I/II-fold pyridoxal phosphate-dependent enzyme n=1 Tax=Rubrivirga sp. TaxID=1885344 RepID=UPI003C772553